MAKRKKRVDLDRVNKIPLKKKIILFFLGGLIGLINGFFGGGGGVMGVPILEKQLGVDNKTAHATCMALILPLSIVSSTLYVFSGAIDTNLFLFVGLGVLVGGVLGALLLKILPEKIVRVVFAMLLFAGGVRLIIWCL